MKKLISILVAFAMMAMLSITAFAANPATSTEAGESVETPVTKAIEKSGNEANPNETYTLNLDNTVAPQGVSLSDDTVTITADQTLDDIFADYTFAEPGIYEFEVTEAAPVADPTKNITVNGRVATKTYDSEDELYTITETTTYSAAKYTVKVVVATDTKMVEGSAVTTKYIKQVAVVKDLNDAGATDESTGKKPDVSDDTSANGFKFTNKFNKKIENKNQGDTNETKDSTTARLSKEVTLAEGVEAGTEIPDQEFNFKVTVKFPANSTEDAYTATVKGTGATGTVTFTKGSNNTATATVTLKAGQWLSFDTIETGATVTAVEDTYPGFEVSDDSVLTGIANDTAGVALDVTNEWDPSEGTVTGILMSNIPYIVLALVAIGGLCAYVVVRRKNADEA